MSKTSVASKPAKPEAHTIPLEDVTITWAPVHLYQGPQERVTVSGRDVAIALQFLAIQGGTDPTAWRQGADADTLDVDLRGLTEILSVLSEAGDDTLRRSSIDLGMVLFSLARRVREIHAQHEALRHADEAARAATVTVAKGGA
jgi:hypothetical protein